MDPIVKYEQFRNTYNQTKKAAKYILINFV